MKISSKGRYALRLMIDLAEHDTGENITLKDISARQEISIKYLEQIVSTLTKAGLLISIRGSHGGYRLMKKPREYTSGDILRVTEGDLIPLDFISKDKNLSSLSETCPAIGFWSGFEKVINEYVDSVTLEDLVNDHQTKIGNNYMI